jgi:DNA/RNA endonuclease YhcR with UshA esterase domain
MTALADGTGPLTYQWYFEPTNGSGFAALPGQTTPTLSLANLAYANAGSYYVTAMGGAGSANSATSSVVVIPPVTVSIAQLHGLMHTNSTGTYTIGLGQYVTVSGRITTFEPFTSPSSTISESYIQDGTGGLFVYLGGYGTNSVPAPGSLVTITGPCQVYSGQLEIDPTVGSVINGVTNGIVVSNTVPLMPAPQPGNFSLLATNALGVAGIDVQCALLTFTNIYIYGSKTGGAVTGNGGIFYSNSYTLLYMTQGPYNSPNNTNYMELYVPAYGNGSISTNFWGKPVPNHVYQLTGVMANFKGASELDVTRYDDFVINPPASFPVSLSSSNNSSLVTWPAVSGSTYSVYRSTNLMGPWSQVFGLGYYPTNGAYLDTNSAPAKFYRVSTP